MPHAAITLPLLALLLATTASVAPEPGGVLLAGEMHARLLEAGASARVRILYRVRPAPDARAVPLAVLEFGPAFVSDVVARIDGRGARAEIVAEGARTRVDVALPPDAAGRALLLEVSYRVPGTGAANGTGRARLPVLAVLWPPAEALPGTFTAEARLPGGLSAYEPFPSTLRAAGSVDGGRRYRVGLQVVPAVVAFTLTRGPRPLFSIPRAIDALALALIGAFTLFGWRRLRPR